MWQLEEGLAINQSRSELLADNMLELAVHITPRV